MAGTPFDFTSPHAVGERIAEVRGERCLLLLLAHLTLTHHARLSPTTHAQVPGGNGYDHNLVLFGLRPQAPFLTRKDQPAAST